LKKANWWLTDQIIPETADSLKTGFTQNCSTGFSNEGISGISSWNKTSI
jgi:hypothetical protein